MVDETPVKGRMEVLNNVFQGLVMGGGSQDVVRSKQGKSQHTQYHSEQ